MCDIVGYDDVGVRDLVARWFLITIAVSNIMRCTRNGTSIANRVFLIFVFIQRPFPLHKSVERRVELVRSGPAGSEHLRHHVAERGFESHPYLVVSGGCTVPLATEMLRQPVPVLPSAVFEGLLVPSLLDTNIHLESKRDKLSVGDTYGGNKNAGW